MYRPNHCSVHMWFALSTFTLLGNHTCCSLHQSFSIIPTWNSVSVKQWPPILLDPHTLESTVLLSVSEFDSVSRSSGIMQSLSSCVCLISHSITSLRFLHLKWIVPHCVYLLRFVCPFISQGTCGLLPPLAIVSNAAASKRGCTNIYSCPCF